MADIENRAAEHGSIIINDTTERAFTKGKYPAALRVLEATVIETLESSNCEGVDYYVGISLDVDSPVILANVTKLKLTSGAVQAVYS